MSDTPRYGEPGYKTSYQKLVDDIAALRSQLAEQAAFGRELFAEKKRAIELLEAAESSLRQAEERERVKDEAIRAALARWDTEAGELTLPVVNQLKAALTPTPSREKECHPCHSCDGVPGPGDFQHKPTCPAAPVKSESEKEGA